MDWLQVLIIILANFIMFFWLRREAADRQETQSILRDITAELKEYRGRLCAIEERNKK